MSIHKEQSLGYDGRAVFVTFSERHFALQFTVMYIHETALEVAFFAFCTANSAEFCCFPVQHLGVSWVQLYI